MTCMLMHLLDIDACISVACVNGGNYIDGVIGYTCTCAAGYTDSNCQTASMVIFSLTLILHDVQFGREHRYLQ